MKVAANTADAGGQKLAFFQSRILGLARECDKLAASSKEVKFHQARVVDLWSLLPCFCRRAVDIVASLPALTSVLKKALEDRRYPQLVLFISTGLVSLVVSSDGGGISTTQSEILSEAAVELLPVMFKIVALNDKPPTEDLKTQMKMTASEVSERSHQTQSLCEAIAALSRCAPTPFLHGLFKKLMQRLLEEAQSGISDSSKVCAFLCLCQSLVSSRVLDENSISFLYRALKPMIRNDEQDARIQKRAYKVLAEMCECHHSFFFDITRLQETIELLTGTMGTSQIAARHMRLKCMNIIIDGFDDTHSEHVDELMHVLAEILLCLKDPNAKTREAGYQLLLSIAMRKDMAGFLQTVTAALGAETPHMRSAAVMALSRLVFEFGWEDESLHILLPSLLRTVLVLVNENSREVIKSTIGFIRISVAAIPAEQLEPVLPELLGGLLHYHKAKSRFRSKIKIILKKLIKLFGYDALTPYVPETETRLLTHMRKLEERQARRKAEAKAEGRNMDQFDEMFDSDEEDSDDGRTWMSGATGFTKLTARNGGKLRSVARSSDSKMSKATMASRATSTSASKLESSTRLPDETDGDVVDMLDSKFAKRVKFNDQSANSDSDGAMEFDDDGRLIVRDEGAVVALESMDEGRAEQQQKFIGNKRQRLGKLDCVKTKESDVKSKKSGKRGRELGSQYKSKKAGGDVRKKDQKFEPYAFVPLDGKSYSKKNRRGAVEQMSSVVRQGGKRKR
jgi:ribosomal RNA-processing protein 12